MRTSHKRPVLGITMGDPSGIGPEVVLRAVRNARVRRAARLVVFGDEGILARVARELHLPATRWVRLEHKDAIPARGGPFLMQVGSWPVTLALKGRPTAMSGAAAAACVAHAVTYTMAGEIQGIVTAPLSKEALHKAGLHWPGHTEMLASITHADRPVMMMAGAGLRIALVTTHAAIARLPGLITRRAVLETVRITARDLMTHFGIPQPRIAVCGLNPHAGESGLFGPEEKRAIAPAVRAARAEGIRCDGPLPADVAFTPACRRRYDAFVAMFHDQATIPVKMLAFDSGVNITLGLPIIRTSPDHGTAYDIVRRGVADPGSMIAAILTAAEMVRRSAPAHAGRKGA